jgi:hypothetical protein
LPLRLFSVAVGVGGQTLLAARAEKIEGTVLRRQGNEVVWFLVRE